MQVLQFTEFSDLFFGLAHRSLVRQGLGDGIALDLVGQAEVAAVARFFGSMAATRGLAATQVTQTCNLIGDVGSLAFR